MILAFLCATGFREEVYCVGESKVGANGGQVGENKRSQLPFSKSIAKYYQFSMECTIDGGVHHSRGALHHFECTTKVECTKIVHHQRRTAPFSSAPRKWMTRSTGVRGGRAFITTASSLWTPFQNPEIRSIDSTDFNFTILFIIGLFILVPTVRYTYRRPAYPVSLSSGIIATIRIIILYLHLKLCT